MNIKASHWLLGAAVAPVASVAIALYTQHVLGMMPCPWCVLQRVIFLSIALVAVAALLLRGALPRRGAAALMLVLAGCGVAAASVSCNLSFADRVMNGSGLDALWPEVFAPQASCADAAATLLGVPYEFYSLTLFVMLAAAAVMVWRRPD